MRLKLFVLVLMLNCRASVTLAQQPPVFHSGDRICFVGNSITQNGEFYNNLQFYYAARYPAEDINFYNCGISGDVAGGVLKRLDDDILVHKPTWCFVMLGMNDVNRSLYSVSRNNEPGIQLLRQQALDTYRTHLELIVQRLLASGSKVVLEKPTIYDQTAVLPAENLFGVNDALKKCADYIQTLAGKYQLKTVDYFSLLNRLNHDIQRKDPAATLTTTDRVHPQTLGHFLMTYQWLMDMHAERKPLQIKWDAHHKNLVNNCSQCRIISGATAGDTVKLVVQENGLPFIVAKDALPALDLIPFSRNFNREILKLPHLRGRYRLLIDDTLIGEYDAQRLKAGINLADSIHTPQYQQALKVFALCRQYRAEEAKLRDLKFVEYGQQLTPEVLADTLLIKKVLEKRITQYQSAANYDYFKIRFEKYLINKPRQQMFEARLTQLHNEIMKASLPSPHSYKLIKTDENKTN